MHGKGGIPDENDVRLKVHLVLETQTGERIAEIKTDELFRDMFSEHAIRSAERTLTRLLEIEVLSPARGLIRGHVLKLKERCTPTFKRADRTVEDCPENCPENWPGDDETVRALHARIASIHGGTLVD